MKKPISKYIHKNSRLIAVLVVLTVFVATNTLVATFAQAQDTPVAAAVDTKEPSDVENLKATAGDSEVTVTWDSATDDNGVVGYKIYRGTHAVKKTDDRYDLPVIPVGAVQSYTVKNLTNGQAYFFTVTAVDAAGNESPNYALEVSATPEGGLHGASVEDDGKSPQVKKVIAEDNITVLVEFSEPIKLPEEHPASAFQIENIATKARLVVQKAEIDEEDSKQQTILLTTAPQQDGAEYVLTAGIELQDLFNNPVISGTSDTGSFKGSPKNKQVASVETSSDSASKGDDVVVTEPPLADADTTSPTISEAVADFNNRISVTFSEKVVLPLDPTKKVFVYKKGTSVPLKVINVSLSVDEKTIYITTDTQAGIDYDVLVNGVSDTFGNTIKAADAKTSVTGNTTGLKDMTPPEDVTALTGVVKDKEKSIVELRWKASKNSAGDLADQILYQSEGKTPSTFGTGAPLGSDPTGAQVQDLTSGKWYTFKITTKDTSGNESKGVLKSIYLPKTGPGMVAAGLTSCVMGLYSRRKKKLNEKTK